MYQFRGLNDDPWSFTATGGQTPGSKVMIFVPPGTLSPGVTQTAPGQQVPPAGTQVTAVTAAPSGPFYTTWWGLGLIGVAAFLGYRHYKKSKAA